MGRSNPDLPIVFADPVGWCGPDLPLVFADPWGRCSPSPALVSLDPMGYLRPNHGSGTPNHDNGFQSSNRAAPEQHPGQQSREAGLESNFIHYKKKIYPFWKKGISLLYIKKLDSSPAALGCCPGCCSGAALVLLWKVLSWFGVPLPWLDVKQPIGVSELELIIQTDIGAASDVNQWAWTNNSNWHQSCQRLSVSLD